MRRGFKVWRCGRDQIGQGVVAEGGGDFGEKMLKERAKRESVICRKCSKSPDDW